MVLNTPSLAGDFYLNFFMGVLVEIPAYTLSIIIIKYVIPIRLLVFHDKLGVHYMWKVEKCSPFISFIFLQNLLKSNDENVESSSM